MRKSCTSFLVVLLAGGCASTSPDPRTKNASISGEQSTEFGRTKAQAIEVCMPEGERAYLSRLTCESGVRARYERTGGVGPRSTPPPNMSDKEVERLMLAAIGGAPLEPGQPDLHIVDGFDVTCGAESITVYMDMYHCPGETITRAPTGLKLD